VTEEQQKEQFSRAYILAIAAAAGINVYQLGVDDDSVDIGFATDKVAQRPRLEAQLKCSAVAREDKKSFQFDLRIKNYQELRVDSVIPRILILVVVPAELGDWMTLTTRQLTLKKAAYWVSLREAPETTNTASVTVSIPKKQLFDVETLRKLLKEQP